MTAFVDLAQRADDLLGRMDDALADLRRYSFEAAEAERLYRVARREAWAGAPEWERGNAEERSDWVKAETAAEREERDAADYLRQSSLETVRSLRQNLSVLQTIANAERAEAEFVKGGGETSGRGPQAVAS